LQAGITLPSAALAIDSIAPLRLALQAWLAAADCSPVLPDYKDTSTHSFLEGEEASPMEVDAASAPANEAGTTSCVPQAVDVPAASASAAKTATTFAILLNGKGAAVSTCIRALVMLCWI
jgi:hypothetical protein